MNKPNIFQILCFNENDLNLQLQVDFKQLYVETRYVNISLLPHFSKI